MAAEHIYVIEDERLQRDRLAAILTGQGYQVTAFATVDAAMGHMGWQADAPFLSRNLPDAIITDNRTPGTMNGLDMLRAAKEAAVPRMMLSADMKESQVIAAGGSQAKLFFKPCDDKELLGALRGLLDAKLRSR